MSSYTAGKLVKTAYREVGYLEKASDYRLDDLTANAGSANYTKYGKLMHRLYPSVMDFPAAWCDCFVDWCHYKASGDDAVSAKAALRGDFDDWTVASKQYYVNAGQYGPKPRLGAQVFFRNSSGVCHTGIVVGYDEKYVHTIEGNTSGASGVVANGGGVCSKTYSREAWSIDGYGYPKYSIEPARRARYRLTKDLSVRNGASKSCKKLKTAKAGITVAADSIAINKAGNTWIRSSKLGGWMCIGKSSGKMYAERA